MKWLLMLALAASPAAPSGTDKAAAKAPAAKKAAPAPAKKAARPAPAPPPAEAPLTEDVPPPPYRWSVPQQLDFVHSIGPQVSDGVPMVLEMARSSMPIDLLIQHYADDFEKAGLFIPPDVFQTSPVAEPRLTALDPVRMVAYTVIFQPNPDRSTTLYLGTADMSAYQPGGDTKLSWAPVMPGAQKLMRTELEVAQSAVYSVTATEEEVLTFYRQSLGPQGYTEAEPGLFVRGTESLRVFTEKDEGTLMVGLTRKTQGGEAVAPAPTP